LLEVELIQLVEKITFEKCEKQHIELKKAAGVRLQKFMTRYRVFQIKLVVV
jgi:hypothetical protein